MSDERVGDPYRLRPAMTPMLGGAAPPRYTIAAWSNAFDEVFASAGSALGLVATAAARRAAGSSGGNYHRPHTAVGNKPPASRLKTGVTNVATSNT